MGSEWSCFTQQFNDHTEGSSQAVGGDCLNLIAFCLSPCVVPEQPSKCLSSCMWTELSSSHCLEGAEARRVFDAQEYARAIVFKEGFDCAGKTCKVTAAELDQEDGDLYVVDENFRWTYVHTHEDGWCGPYFCWNTANGISGS